MRPTATDIARSEEMRFQFLFERVRRQTIVAQTFTVDTDCVQASVVNDRAPH